MSPADLKAKGTITRADIAALLSSLGAPGEKRSEKLDAVRQLGLYNNQNLPLEVTLESYAEY